MRKLLLAATLVAAVMVVSMPGTASAVSCTSVATSKGALTAAQVGGNLTGTLDATGCDIGVYYDASHTGNVASADISGATQYGVFVDGGAGDVTVNVTGSTISDIGDHPHTGAQHGVGVYYYGYKTTGTVGGTVSGNTVTDYQKGGIVVNGANASASVDDNTVTGLGSVSFIAQNGIQFGYGARGEARGNTIDGNWYTGASWTSTGLLLFDVDASQVKTSENKFIDNQTNYALVERHACPHMFGGFYEGYGLCLAG